MENYSDSTSETSADEQLEKAQIEGLVGVNDEDDDVLNTCQAAERFVKCSLKKMCRWWTHVRFKPSLEAFIEDIAAFWICSFVFNAIQRGIETATVAARWAAKQDAMRKAFESSMRSWARRAAR